MTLTTGLLCSLTQLLLLLPAKRHQALVLWNPQDEPLQSYSSPTWGRKAVQKPDVALGKPLVPAVPGQHCPPASAEGKTTESRGEGVLQGLSSWEEMKPSPSAGAVLVHLLVHLPKALRGTTCFLKSHSPPPHDPSSTRTLPWLRSSRFLGCSARLRPGMSPALLSLPRPENTVVVAVSTYVVSLRSYKQNSSDQSGGQGEGKTSSTDPLL